MDLHIKRANKITCRDWIFLPNSSQVITAHLVKDISSLDNIKFKITIEAKKHLIIIVSKDDFLLCA